MKRNPKFKTIKFALCALSFYVALFSEWASAAPIHGKFANGQSYQGDYSVTDTTNADGMKAQLVTLKIRLDNRVQLTPYTYIVDDIPKIEASDIGLILIVVKSGGMEGTVTYNYIVPYKESLASLGVIQTSLHLGKVESISIQRNKIMGDEMTNQWITNAIQFNPSSLENHQNAYENSSLLLLGSGKFSPTINNENLHLLINSKEISDDLVFQKALKEFISNETIPASPSTEKYVISDKAPFFNSPKPSDKSRSYLIKGDKVSLLRRSDEGLYWLVDYVSSAGHKTEKWLRCEDVGYCN